MQTSKTRAFISGAIGALLVLIAAAIIVPQYGDYTARSRAATVLNSVRPLQDRIASRIIALKSVSGSGIGNSQLVASPVKEIVVLEDGIIIVVGSHFGQVLVLVPSYSSGNVSWRCLGGSAKDVPPQCRG